MIPAPEWGPLGWQGGVWSPFYPVFTFPVIKLVTVGRSSQILKSKQCNPLICDIKEGHKASTQTKFH